MESVSNWLYFFSTIAQVFAALVGLSIIFYTYFIGKYQQDIVVKINTMFSNIPSAFIGSLESQIKAITDEDLKAKNLKIFRPFQNLPDQITRVCRNGDFHEAKRLIIIFNNYKNILSEYIIKNELLNNSLKKFYDPEIDSILREDLILAIRLVSKNMITLHVIIIITSIIMIILPIRYDPGINFISIMSIILVTYGLSFILIIIKLLTEFPLDKKHKHLYKILFYWQIRMN